MECGSNVEAAGIGSLRDVAHEMMERELALGDAPALTELCFASVWAVAVLSDGRAGRAFLFNCQHAVYGDLDYERLVSSAELIGWSVADVIAWALDGEGEPSPEGPTRARVDAGADAGSGADAGGAREASFRSLRRSIALACLNALAQRDNDPSALEGRGYRVLPADDRSFLRAEDRVALIGAGMLLQEAADTCARVDVIDMRPRSALQSVLVTDQGVRTGPRDVSYHGVEETDELVGAADVVGITGCALENDTLFGIARLAKRAREFVVFGPSAQIPFDMLERLGTTIVLANRVVDAHRLIDRMLSSFIMRNDDGTTESSVVRLAPPRR